MASPTTKRAAKSALRLVGTRVSWTQRPDLVEVRKAKREDIVLGLKLGLNFLDEI